jgi:predicted GIY-YIG superfamily endonuclease
MQKWNRCIGRSAVQRYRGTIAKDVSLRMSGRATGRNIALIAQLRRERKSSVNICNPNGLKREEVGLTMENKITGIYFLYNEAKEIIYIGKTTDFKQRLNTHLKNGEGRFQDNEVKYFSILPVEDKEMMSDLEYYRINKHRPKYNIALKRPVYKNHRRTNSFAKEVLGL